MAQNRNHNHPHHHSDDVPLFTGCGDLPIDWLYGPLMMVSSVHQTADQNDNGHNRLRTKLCCRSFWSSSSSIVPWIRINKLLNVGHGLIVGGGEDYVAWNMILLLFCYKWALTFNGHKID